MPRNTQNADVEETAGEAQGPEATGDAAPKEKKAKKEPARGALPEGYVTPVGLATELSKPIDGNADNKDNSNYYHTDKNGEHLVRPQMVYSYKKNAPKDDPFPSETVKDSLGHDREALKLADGLAWWARKNERVAAKKANAAAKAAKKEANATKKAAASAEASTDEAEATDAG
jgi:hypothetical protein